MRGKSLVQRISEYGLHLAVDAHAAWIAARHPSMPRSARWIALGVAAYALSPIDLIPDFIPVVGWIDDLLIVPFGLWIVRKLTPDSLWADCRAQAKAAIKRPSSRAGMAFILSLWTAALFLLYWAVRTSPTH